MYSETRDHFSNRGHPTLHTKVWAVETLESALHQLVRYFKIYLLWQSPL